MSGTSRRSGACNGCSQASTGQTTTSRRSARSAARTRAPSSPLARPTAASGSMTADPDFSRLSRSPRSTARASSGSRRTARPRSRRSSTRRRACPMAARDATSSRATWAVRFASGTPARGRPRSPPTRIALRCRASRCTSVRRCVRARRRRARRRLPRAHARARARLHGPSRAHALGSRPTARARARALQVAAVGSKRRTIKIFDVPGETTNSIRYYDGFLGTRIGSVGCLAFHPHKLLMAAGATGADWASMVSIYSC